jgi:hypothetical protein
MIIDEAFEPHIVCLGVIAHWKQPMMIFFIVFFWAALFAAQFLKLIIFFLFFPLVTWFAPCVMASHVEIHMVMLCAFVT